MPLQVSATSQTPAAARQTVPFGDSELLGQLGLEPLQVSAGSQGPVVGVQIDPTLLNKQFDPQHDAVVPLAAPWSHSSPLLALITPLPQYDVITTLTK